jgi:predicted MFS family arabinose efflux permease
MAGCVAIALAGDTVAHFLVALFLLGTGWNFMYTGGTLLLTETYTPAERARVQGVNDAIIFTTVGVSSFASGALVSSVGWETMNLIAIPILLFALGALLWLSRSRRAAAAASA